MSCAGHYITYVRNAEQWICFDDKAVGKATQREVESCFGDAQWAFNNDMHAYVLFYQLLPSEPAAPTSGTPPDGSSSSPTSGAAA